MNLIFTVYGKTKTEIDAAITETLEAFGGGHFTLLRVDVVPYMQSEARKGPVEWRAEVEATVD